MGKRNESNVCKRNGIFFLQTTATRLQVPIISDFQNLKITVRNINTQHPHLTLCDRKSNKNMFRIAVEYLFIHLGEDH